MTPARSTLLACLVIAPAAFAVYSPGVTAAPEFDQTQYFVERQEWPTFADALHRLDYALARRYWKGDEGQYRPLVFLLMAAEYQLFGTDMRGWHAVNLTLHVLVALLLYRLLRTMHSPGASLVLAAVFTVLTTSASLVQETYVGGYLLACALLVAAVHSAWRNFDCRDEPRVRDWIPYVLLLTLSSLAFEVMAVMSVILACGLLIERRRRGLSIPRWLPIVLLLPCAFYTAAYLPRLFVAPRLLFVDDVPASNVLAAEQLTTYPRRVVLLLIRYVTITAVPAIRPFFPVFFEEMLPPSSLRTAATIVNAGMVAGVVFLLLSSGGLMQEAKARWRAAAVGVLMVIYVGLIRFGRGATEETHPYVFGLLAVVALGLLLEAARLNASRRRLMLSLLVTLGVTNAYLSAGLTSRYGRDGGEYARYLSSLDRFVRSHRAEPGFSFYVEESEILRPVTIVEGYPDKPVKVEEKWLWETFPGAVSEPAVSAYRLEWNGQDLVVHP